MKELRFRDNVTWMSFLLTLLVILAHSMNAGLFLGEAAEGSAADAVQAVVGGNLAQIAVPGFFMLSAALFFRNYRIRDTQDKFLRRVRSLLIPYLLWNTLYYLGYVIATRIPGLSGLVGVAKAPLDLRTFLKAVFLYEYNHVFWYLFQLLLLTLLSPLIYCIVRRPYAFLGTMFLLAVVIFLRADPTVLNADACFYYTAAAFVTVHARPKRRRTYRMDLYDDWERAAFRRKWKPRQTLSSLLIFLLAVIFQWIAVKTANDLSVVLCRLFGAFGVWSFLMSLPLPSPAPFMYDTFFIYAFHFAPVRLINKGLARVFHGSEAASIVIFFLMPAVTVFLAEAVCSFGRKRLPFLFSLFTGSRNLREE